jgi:hypothetical protein
VFLLHVNLGVRYLTHFRTYAVPHLCRPDYEREGFASRGYWVFRRGRNVITRFGSISIDRGRRYHVRWRYGDWNERIISCRTASEAAVMVKEIIHDKTRQQHGIGSCGKE